MSRSSTSSSDAIQLSGGFPAAFALALVLVAAVEVGVRWIGPERMVANLADGEWTFPGVASWLEERGPAEVTIVGSSRAREGVVVPLVQETLEGALARPVSVGNYSVPGVSALDIESLVGLVLRTGRPRLVAYGLTPRALAGAVGHRRETARFWDAGELVARYREGPDEVGPLAATVVRAEVGRCYRTLRHRRRPSIAIRKAGRALVRGEDPLPPLLLEPLDSPWNGGMTRNHRTQPDVSLVTRPISEERVRRYLERLTGDGVYELDEAKLESLERMLATLRTAEVSVVLFEVPVSDILRRAWPEGTVADFQRRVEEVASRQGVRFVRFEQLEVQLADEHFLEQSHLNLHGARLVSTALAERVLVPALGGDEDDASGL